MSKFGDYIKKIRKEKGISQAKVFDLTGITDSRLSKAENGADGTLNPPELKKIAALYGVPVVSLYIIAGYLDDVDLEEYRSGFKNTELLDEEEKKHVQDQIDFINRRKGKLS